MTSPGNQHCANCIGTLPFPISVCRDEHKWNRNTCHQRRTVPLGDRQNEQIHTSSLHTNLVTGWGVDSTGRWGPAPPTAINPRRRRPHYRYPPKAFEDIRNGKKTTTIPLVSLKTVTTSSQITLDLWGTGKREERETRIKGRRKAEKGKGRTGGEGRLAAPRWFLTVGAP